MKPVLFLALFVSLQVSAAIRVEIGTTPGERFNPAGLGTAAPVWNSPGRYQTWAEGFQRGGFRLFRFPNGSLSNEYHWNGKGSFDSAGLWTPSATEIGPGFTCRSLWRGTTMDNYGARFPSHLTDGDTNSFWRGETYQDTILPWAILDLGSEKTFDSVEILWGTLRPASFRVEAWTGPSYPLPQNGDPHFWRQALVGNVKSSHSGVSGKPASSRYVSLRVVQAPQGVQIREVRLFQQGRQVTENNPDPRRQTKVACLGTHPGNAGRDQPWIPEWTFDRFAEWLKSMSGAEALICVNFGTGTPEEAAAWVRYANVVKKYGIRKWHVGNEMDGNWEEGGPVDPAQYAVRFAQFAKAMKAVDSSIEVYGPGTYSVEFWQRRSGREDGLSWIESFLERVAREERAAKMRLLDGVDFHSYPYWFEKGPATEEAMLEAIGKFGPALDTLGAIMARRLDEPETRKIALSEFNTTVKITAITMEATNGIGIAMILQDLWKRFPSKAVSILWEPSGGEPMNPDGGPIESYGSLRVFTPARGGLQSDLTDPPTGSFWGQFMVRTWMGAAGSRTLPVTSSSTSVRLSAATDSVTWSLLAINPSTDPETLAVKFPSAAPRTGEILVWNATNYAWSDRTSQGRAIPNFGPTAKPIAESDSLTVLPPRSVTILRRGRPSPAVARVLHLAWTPGRLRPSDTLTIFASVAADGHRIRGASWNLGKAGAGNLPSFDGAWDGSHEAVLAHIPATSLPRGIHQVLNLVFQIEGASPLTIPVKIDNEDFPRPLAFLDSFDEPGLHAKNGQTWWVYGNGNNGTNMTLEQVPDAPGGHLQGTFHIVQPPTQGYPNFAIAGLNLSPHDFEASWKGYQGLVFDIRSHHSGSSGKFLLQALTTTVKDYDDYQVELPNTDGVWRRVWVRWDSFRQAGWGKDLGPFDQGFLRTIQFRADGEGSGTLELDNLAFWGTEGTALELRDPPRPTRGPMGR